jgi:hypothetical protein
MQVKVQIISIVITGGMLLLVIELVRRKRLQERYALMLGLAIWRQGLEWVADTAGIDYAPSALFALAFAFVLVLLLHFSLLVSRLSDQTKVLAQEIGMLQHRLDAQEAESDRPVAEGARSGP